MNHILNPFQLDLRTAVSHLLSTIQYGIHFLKPQYFIDKYFHQKAGNGNQQTH